MEEEIAIEAWDAELGAEEAGISMATPLDNLWSRRKMT